LSLYFVYLSQRQLSPKVRAFIDFVIESIGKEPYSEHWSRAGAAKSRPTLALKRRA